MLHISAASKGSLTGYVCVFCFLCTVFSFCSLPTVTEVFKTSNLLMYLLKSLHFVYLGYHAAFLDLSIFILCSR